jgi:putative DNA primase/helicase
MKHDGAPIDVLMRRLANAKKSGKGYICSCPAHGGHDCLSVEEKDGRVLVHCFAGCSAQEVVESVDLRLSDLFADSLNPERRREYDIQAAVSARDRAKLIMDIAAVQLDKEVWTKEDLQTLADANDTYSRSIRALEELQESEPQMDQDFNPFLRRLAYDSDSALDRIANQQWLIDSVIPADAFGVIYGPSGAYKSFIALDMAASVASALAWHGRDVDNSGHVIYIAAEGAAGLHLRKKAWEIRYRTPIDNLGILGSAVTINSAIECQQLIDLCDQAADSIAQDIRLVVIDTLARSFAGDENSAADMGGFIKACDRIREKTGATLLVIHHSGKDAEKGARGSSALRAACDFEFKVVSSGKKVTKLTCTKAKDTDPIEDIEFKLESVEIGRKDAKGRDMVSLVPKATHTGDDSMGHELTGHANTVNNIIAAEIARNGGSCMKQFVQDSFYHAVGGKSDANRKAFARALDQLVIDGWITIDAHGKIERAPIF